jgi:hypothetical protein
MTRALVLFSLNLGATISIAEESKGPLPTVVSATVPFYPRTARLARIEGVVRLQISTDGRRVSTISVKGGPPVLIPAAEENVRTWLFKEHKPTTFEVTFHYKMLPESECEADNGTVLLRLPTEVEVTAKGVQTCDPADQGKH